MAGNSKQQAVGLTRVFSPTECYGTRSHAKPPRRKERTALCALVALREFLPASIHFTDEGVLQRVDEILGVFRIQLQLAGDLHDPAPQRLALAGGHLDQKQRCRRWHLAEPAANGVFDQQERVDLEVIAQRLHVAGERYLFAVELLQVVGEGGPAAAINIGLGQQQPRDWRRGIVARGGKRRGVKLVRQRPRRAESQGGVAFV